MVFGEMGRIAGIVIAFRPGARPDAKDIRAMLSGHPHYLVTRDPFVFDPNPSLGCDTNRWLEILTDGLAFELRGLDPGPSEKMPRIDRRLKCGASADFSGFEAIGLFPGPHISSGVGGLPVLRAMARFAADLVWALDGVQAVCWRPSGSAMGPAYFIKAMEEWMRGGRLPADVFVGCDALHGTYAD